MHAVIVVFVSPKGAYYHLSSDSSPCPSNGDDGEACPLAVSGGGELEKDTSSLGENSD